MLPGTVLVDGSVGASWQLRGSQLEITALTDLGTQCEAIRDEGLGLLRLLAPDARRPEVIFAAR